MRSLRGRLCLLLIFGLVLCGSLWADVYKKGFTIPLTFEIYDLVTGATVTGESPTVSIYRTSDGYFFDWDDDTFKASGWTTKEQTLTEIGTEGRYYESVDSTAFSETNYVAFFENTGANASAGTYTFTIGSVDYCPDCPSLGSGSVPVNHNYPDALDQQATDDQGAPLRDVYIRVYLKTNYDAGNLGAQYVEGMTESDANGYWEESVWLDPGYDYVTVFQKAGYQTTSYEFEVTAP